jgi:hypothetical protein
MIQITVYLRDEKDLEKWRQVPNKAEFMHNALNGISPQYGSPESLHAKQKVVVTPPSGVTNSGDSMTPQMTTSIKVPTHKPIDGAKGSLCPVHKIPMDGRGKCLQKGCKYA